MVDSVFRLRIRIYSTIQIPDPDLLHNPDPRSGSTPQSGSQIRIYSTIRIPDPDLLHDPDPRSGTTNLHENCTIKINKYEQANKYFSPNKEPNGNKLEKHNSPDKS